MPASGQDVSSRSCHSHAVKDAYDATPAGDVRRGVADGSFAIKGDAERTVAAMIAYADEPKPRQRLALGSAAFENIERSLRARMEDLQAGKDVALFG